MRAKLESGASFSFVWLTILIILLIPIFALINLYLVQTTVKMMSKVKPTSCVDGDNSGINIVTPSITDLK